MKAVAARAGTAVAVADRFIERQGPDGGRIFACIAPDVRFTEARLADSRLFASLTPFPDEESALSAFQAVGAGPAKGVR